MSGKLHAAIGPMFSGKTEWLIEQLENSKSQRLTILPIRFAKDTRYSDTEIVSHNERKIRAIGAETADDIRKITDDHNEYDVIGIDEMQFYEPKLAEICSGLKDNGKIVYASGLDTDFKAIEWETTKSILKIADSVEQLLAICSVCDQPNARFTQRLVTDSQERFLIGGEGLYTARCKLHYEEPELV